MILQFILWIPAVPSSRVSVPRPVSVPAGQFQFAHVQFPYDQKLDSIREQVHRWIRELMTDSPAPTSASTSASNTGSASASAVNATLSEFRKNSLLKRIILMDIMRLCRFFGQEATMDRLLTQLLTFLNAQVSLLCYVLFKSLYSNTLLCAGLGAASRILCQNTISLCFPWSHGDI